MIKSKKVTYGFFALALVAAFIAGNAVMKAVLDNTPGAKEARAVVSQYRPGIELLDLDNKMRNLDEWNGKVVVVNFWATWCPPCREEMPAFVELQERYGASGLQFIGVALDDRNKVEDFADTTGVEYPILLGDAKTLKVATAYGNRLGALPYTAIINREGFIVKTFRGEVSLKSMEKIINRWL